VTVDPARGERHDDSIASGESDDRHEFELHKQSSAVSMSQDTTLVNKADDVLRAALGHDWSYQWTWLGLPIIQLPTDMLGFQEVVWATRPQLIIETGVARGGSLVFFASLLRLIGEGSVLGIDIDIRPHNRRAIESHPLSEHITLLHGSSIDPTIVEAAGTAARAVERVMVVLDSNHSHDHVLAELHAYSPLVTAGQYLIVADTVIDRLPDEGKGRPWGPGDNPATALREFLAEDSRFDTDRTMDEKLLMTSCPGGYLRRLG
jgi:cephalosporin hydroxylase